MGLTESVIKGLAFAGSNKRYGDGRSLFLVVTRSGKYWDLYYRVAGKQKSLRLGAHPKISLREARRLAEDARTLLAEGKDPAVEKRIAKVSQEIQHLTIFRDLSDRWLEMKKPHWSEKHYQDQIGKLNLNILPTLGDLPVTKINATIVLALIDKIAKRGASETAKRTLTIISSVLDLGVAMGQIQHNPAHPLKRIGVIKAKRVEHYPTLDWGQLPEFLRDLSLNQISATETSLNAILLCLHTACRPGEAFEGLWAEVDLANGIWTIPADRMKSQIEHMIPLSSQVITLLKRQQEISCNDFIFSSVRNDTGRITNNTMNMVLKRLGYQITPHGFRSFFLQNVQEKLGFSFDLADRQLAHLPKGKVRQAYDRGNFLDQRKSMMQAWSDLIDRTSVDSCENPVVNLAAVPHGDLV